MFLQLFISFLVQYLVFYVVMCSSNQFYFRSAMSYLSYLRPLYMPSWSRPRSFKPVVPTESKQPIVDNVKEELFTITIKGGRSSAWTRRVHVCVRVSIRLYCICSCRQRGWLARRLSYVLFVMERDVNKDMFTRNVVDNVLNKSR